MKLLLAEARADLARLWLLLCLFVVEECQPPGWLRWAWNALMRLFLVIAVACLFIVGILTLAGALAASVRIP